VRGAFLDYVDDPFYVPEEKAARWVPDGLLVISNNGTILDFGNYSDIAGKYPGIPTTTYKVRTRLQVDIDKRWRRPAAIEALSSSARTHPNTP
jgi:guanine deaminase